MGSYPKDIKTTVHTTVCSKYLQAALFRIAKDWKQFNVHQLMKELKKKNVVCQYNGTLFSNEKKQNTVTHSSLA